MSPVAVLEKGYIGGGKKQHRGKYLELAAADRKLRVITGDARNLQQLVGKQKFALLICDLPYGIQHRTPGSTRNPLQVIADCVEPWRGCLRPGGIIVLAFNSNNPRREALTDTFTGSGFKCLPFSEMSLYQRFGFTGLVISECSSLGI